MSRMERIRERYWCSSCVGLDIACDGDAALWAVAAVFSGVVEDIITGSRAEGDIVGYWFEGAGSKLKVLTISQIQECIF